MYVGYYNDPAARVSADDTGLAHANALEIATAWGSEIEMLRVLRAVADLVGDELHQVARAHREMSLVEIGQARGVAREAVIDVVMAALRAGEPIAGLWHQKAELRGKAEQLVDRKPRRAKRTPQQNGDRQNGERQNSQGQSGQPRRPGPRGLDGEGHLDTRA
jgi:hypothetical protein